MKERKRISPQEADRLIRAYFEGMTSEEEENMLRDFLASTEGSEEKYDEVRAVLSFFAEGKAQYRKAEKTVDLQEDCPLAPLGARPARPRRSSAYRFRSWKKWTMVAAAAVLLLVGGATLFLHHPESEYEELLTIASYIRDHESGGVERMDVCYYSTRTGDPGRYGKEVRTLSGASSSNLNEKKRMSPQEMAHLIRTCMEDTAFGGGRNMRQDALGPSEIPSDPLSGYLHDWRNAAVASAAFAVRFVEGAAFTHYGSGMSAGDCCVAYINGKVESDPQIVKQQMRISLELACCEVRK